MKKINKFAAGLVALVLCLTLSVSAFASSGFNAGIEVTREGNEIRVVIQDSSVLHDKQPTLSIPADSSFASAVVLFEETAAAVTYADGQVSFKVTKGGTYYIVKSAVPTESVPATCTEAGKNVYVHNGVEYTETIGEAKGHDFTDTSKETCANCSVSNPNYGATYIPPVIPTPDPESQVSGSTISVGSAEIPVSIKDGVASLETGEDSINDVISQADEDGEVTLDFTSLDGVSAVIVFQELLTGLAQAGVTASAVIAYDLPAGADPAELVITATSADDAAIYLPAKYDNGQATFEIIGAATYTLHLCPMAAFDDVDLDAWYHQSVDYMIENDLMIGTGANSFSPNAMLDRASLVMILWRMEGNPVAREENPFHDVADDAWYADAIAWAGEAKLIFGYSDGLCHPGDVLTREQMVTILWRYAQMKGSAVEVTENGAMDGVSDKNTVSGFARSAMLWAIEKGVIEGTGNRLEPKLGAGRAQIAAVIYRYHQN